MHDTAMRNGTNFFSSYLSSADDVAVLDVGGADLNGSLRRAAPARCRYVSIDLAAAKGVDIVLDDPYRFPFPDGSFDAVVSTSCFEHDALFWLTYLEMCRVTRTGGYVYLNVPSNGVFHQFPIDAWRFYPDAGLALVEWARRSAVTMTLCESFVADAGADGWSDCVTIFRKGSYTEAVRHPIHTLVPCRNVRALGSDTIIKRTAHTGPARPGLIRRWAGSILSG